MDDTHWVDLHPLTGISVDLFASQLAQFNTISTVYLLEIIESSLDRDIELVEEFESRRPSHAAKHSLSECPAPAPPSAQ